jgi:hypothetical protein
MKKFKWSWSLLNYPLLPKRFDRFRLFPTYRFRPFKRLHLALDALAVFVGRIKLESQLLRGPWRTRYYRDPRIERLQFAAAIFCLSFLRRFGLPRDRFAKAARRQLEKNTSGAWVHHRNALDLDFLCRIKIMRETKDSLLQLESTTDIIHQGSDLPDYVALSYVWGKSHHKTSVFLDGKEVKIQSNLQSALRQLKENGCTSWIWADALCINQSDTAEKEYVVPKMGVIFGNATRVYAWLGASNGIDMDSLGRHIQEFGRLFWSRVRDHDSNSHPNPADIAQQCIADALLILQRLHLKGNLRPFLDSYQNIAKRSYWQRVWILQEVYLAKDLHILCGFGNISGRTFSGSILVLESVFNHISNRGCPDIEVQIPYLCDFAMSASAFTDMHSLILFTATYPKTHCSLKLALSTFCVKETPGLTTATDSRDMIFGLLGFATDMEKNMVRPDYESDTTAVYAAFTKSMIRHGFTDILSWCRSKNDWFRVHQTWVPDFSSPIYESMCSQSQAKPWMPKFSATGTSVNRLSAPAFHLNREKRASILSLDGITVDRVSIVGNAWNKRNTCVSDLTRSSQWLAPDSTKRDVPHRQLPHYIAYPLIEAFLSDVEMLCHEARKLSMAPPPGIRDAAAWKRAIWKVPCADQLDLNSGLVRNADEEELEERYRVLRLFLSEKLRDQAAYPEGGQRSAAPLPASHEAGDIAGIDEPTMSLIMPYLRTIMRWVEVAPFCTSKGYIGLGPNNLSEGDLVVLLYGFNAPYILSPTYRAYKTKDQIQFISVKGEAYVDGIMDGELMVCPHEPERFEIL